MKIEILHDVVFSDQGTVVVFSLLTPAGEEWFEENVAYEGWARMGPVIVADHRPARDIITGLLTDGLRVAQAPTTTVIGRW